MEKGNLNWRKTFKPGQWINRRKKCNHHQRGVFQRIQLPFVDFLQRTAMEEEINNISPAPPQHLIENWAGELRICFRWRKIKFEGKSGPGVWVEKRGRPLSLFPSRVNFLFMNISLTRSSWNKSQFRHIYRLIYYSYRFVLRESFRLRAFGDFLSQLTHESIALVLTSLHRTYLELERAHFITNTSEVFCEEVALVATSGEITSSRLQFGNFRA